MTGVVVDLGYIPSCCCISLHAHRFVYEMRPAEGYIQSQCGGKASGGVYGMMGAIAYCTGMPAVSMGTQR